MAQHLMETIGAKRTGPHQGGRRQKYVLTEQGRSAILREYDGTTAVIDNLARRLQVPRNIIKRWASQLGMTRRKEPLWTKDEEIYLEANLHRLSIASLAKTLGRTATAVTLKAKRLGTNKTQEGYTMHGLCIGLGCDHHKVEAWLDKGWITGTRRQTERQYDMWLFTDKAIRAFLRAHPEQIDQRRMDWLWVVDVLVGLGELQ